MRFSEGVRVISRRLSVLVGFFIGALLVAGVASADDYGADWGPEIGSQLTLLKAHDQAGTLRTLDNLAGEQGLLLFLNRSADW
jgi:hypothetical protein